MRTVVMFETELSAYNALGHDALVVFCHDAHCWTHVDGAHKCDSCGGYHLHGYSLNDVGLCSYCAAEVAAEKASERANASSHRHAVTGGY